MAAPTGVYVIVAAGRRLLGGGAVCDIAACGMSSANAVRARPAIETATSEVRVILGSSSVGSVRSNVARPERNSDPVAPGRGSRLRDRAALGPVQRTSSDPAAVHEVCAQSTGIGRGMAGDAFSVFHLGSIAWPGVGTARRRFIGLLHTASRKPSEPPRDADCQGLVQPPAEALAMTRSPNTSPQAATLLPTKGCGIHERRDQLAHRLAQKSTRGPRHVDSRGVARASASSASHHPPHAFGPGLRLHRLSRPLQRA